MASSTECDRRGARRLLLLLAMLFGLATAARETHYVARVVGMTDGDTVVLDTGGRRFAFRLGQIDAPELAQPAGPAAKRALAELVLHRQVAVVESTIDSYGRPVGRLSVGGVDVNAEMVARGHAWVYVRYARDDTLVPLQTAAKSAGQGLWALPAHEQIPPWVWRREHPRSRRAARPPPVASAHCARKSYCRDMSSCAEARDYLRRCGLKTLDGDGDGEPCEALCGMTH